MREILFRAWDPLRNKMWKYAVPTFDGKINVSDREDGAFNEFINGELIEWTGLVDCKGNKIFEGDYLQGNKGESDKWLVIFNDKLSKFEAKFVGRKDSCIENKELYFVDRAFIYDNRFQNPELIKD